MPYIVYSRTEQIAVARFDGRLVDIALREGEVAIPCMGDDDPNDPKWAAEAANFEAAYALSNARTLALEHIDILASAARLRYISTGVGQESTYLTKAAEADAYVAAGRPEVTSSCFMLTAEAASTGSTVSAVADKVQATRNQWVQLAAYVEGIRMGAKALVADANDVQAILSIVAQAKSQFEAI